jgi:pimeloyl-ACP methyl ester carboxylesterase
VPPATLRCSSGPARCPCRCGDPAADCSGAAAGGGAGYLPRGRLRVRVGQEHAAHRGRYSPPETWFNIQHMSSTYVLIPGAWHGGWAWRPVAERLRAAGHQAVCLTLPGLGHGDDPSGHDLQDAVDHVVSEVERKELTNVTFVGHSWGGYPMGGAVHRTRSRRSSITAHTCR